MSAGAASRLRTLLEAKPKLTYVRIRTGGGLDVTLTLPDGRRTTFAFNPRLDPSNGKAYAQWTGPTDVQAVLTNFNSAETELDYFPSLHWASGDLSYGLPAFGCQDVPAWVLQTQDGTQYYITRGAPNNVIYDTSGNGSFVNVRAYGPPALTKIVQRTGDTITIGSDGIAHYAPNATNATRSVFFDRDSQSRITAMHDMISGSNGLPVVKYIYQQDTGNLIQVLKLTDRAAGTYAPEKYHYDNPAFPHYITSIENALGIPVARNLYDSSGRLVALVDASGNTNQVIHNLTNRLEIVIDPLGHTNITAYDLRGNITATTNALNGVTLRAYDDNNKTNEVAYLNGQPYATNSTAYTPEGFLQSQTDPLQHTVSFFCNQYGQVTNTIDARGYGTTNYFDDGGNLTGTADPLGQASTSVFNGSGLLAWSRDALGTVVTNTWDDSGNLIGTATLDASGTILSTNTAAFDANGNQTNVVVWRRVNGVWTGATNTYVLDAQGRRIATIAPDGGISRSVLNELGQAVQTIDALSRTNFHDFDAMGREYRTTYPDGFFTLTLFDAVGNAYAQVDRGGRTNYNLFDALKRHVGTVFADGSTNWTLLDDLGRVRFTVDGRGVTNAAGYNVAGQRTSQTNAWGTAQQNVTGASFDANGNEIYSTNALGVVTTNVFDPLNRPVETDYADGTKTSTGYNAGGQRVAETNQDGIITLFGNDGAGRLTSVTNGFGTTNQAVTRYVNDEAGNPVAQIDALNRTNRFEADAMGRRTKHILPAGQSESWGFDVAGNEIRHTNFNGAVLTNQFDSMNRRTNVSSIGGYSVRFGYSPTGQRTNMVDQSGTTSYLYNARDWLTNKVVAWSSGPVVSLNYGLDANGNVTNIWSSTSGGVNLVYSLDSLNRITNVLAGGSQAASYAFDLNGNLKGIRYGNGITNLNQYDPLNRLTNMVWLSNQVQLASFYYQLGATGNRTNLSESVNGTSRSYSWAFDPLYRLRTETITGLGSVSYGVDLVGNRTNRTAGLDGLPAQNFAYGTNDWLLSHAYDSSGNTLWTTNGAIATGPYYYDVENRLTNFNNTEFLTYNGDSIRVKKTANGTNYFYLVDDRNSTGYAQVLEEWTATGGTTNLGRVYNWGLALISQREASGTVYYFLADGHGSTRLLTDTSGTVVNAFAFDAYGNLIASNGPPQAAHLYCGEYFDPDLGMYSLRARYFNPDTGRFWTADDDGHGDQEDPKSLHIYNYCANNPVNIIDPSGQDGELVSLLTTISIGLNISSAVNHAIHREYGAMLVDIAGAASGGFGLAGGLGLFENSLPSALRFAGAGISASGAVISSANVLKGISIVIAGTDLMMAMSSQSHHIMTDKNYVSGAPNGQGPFTPKFEELLRGTGIKLGDDINIVEVAGHTGPHPEANQYVFDYLQRAVSGLVRGTPEYKAAIEKALKKLGEECATPGTPLNKMLVGR
jgi:RHS repeat-associated protein